MMELEEAGYGQIEQGCRNRVQFRLHKNYIVDPVDVPDRRANSRSPETPLSSILRETLDRMSDLGS